jgi:hypothetical protein
MHQINRCGVCQRLTTLLLCPWCDAATSPLLVASPHAYTVAKAADEGAGSPLVELALEDIKAISQYRGRQSCARERGATSTEEDSARRFQALRSENEALYAKLAGDRHQLLRSAVAIRDLHSTTKELLQHDREVIAELRRENALLHERLSGAKAESLHADAVTERGLVKSPVPPSHPVVISPLSYVTSSQTALSKGHESSYGGSAFLRSSDQALSSSIMEEAPALQNEVNQLRMTVLNKTKELDGLWERVEKAEKYILELLAQLGYAQDLTQEETRNSARLSHHLASIGEPPKDIAAFMAIKDRRATPGSTPSSSLSPSSVSVPVRRNTATKRVSASTH